MVLFVFVVMMLNLGPASVQQERVWLKPAHLRHAQIADHEVGLVFLEYLKPLLAIAGLKDAEPTVFQIGLACYWLIGAPAAWLMAFHLHWA